ncbi:MAG: SH3 domain-containing protein [Desulfobacter sp.]|nr:SH3 domain-containing protein [Desulfobacter sp.]WDP85068.1 MAG: SH3 domain-containing protein [Desulfobacter sp.]
MWSGWSRAISRIVFFFILWAMVSGSAFAAERLAVKSSIANLRDGAGTKYKVLWQVEKYHPFIVVSKKKDWYEIKDFEGDTAWVHKSLLAKINTVISVKEKCNVRSGPDKKTKVVLRVERGVPFKVLKRKGNWIRVEHADGETGWIYKTLVW